MTKVIIFFILTFSLLACSTKQFKYTYNKESQLEQLGPKRNISHYYLKNIGHSYSPSYLIKLGVHFPNSLNLNQNINQIIIKSKETTLYNMNSGKSNTYPNDKYAPFYVNIYDFDPNNNQPSNKLLKNDTLVQLNINEKEITIDVSELNIPFGKNGIFITIENLLVDDYKSLGFSKGPSYGILGVSEKNIVIPYFLNQRLDYKKWKKDAFLIERNNTYDIRIMLSKLEKN